MSRHAGTHHRRKRAVAANRDNTSQRSENGATKAVTCIHLHRGAS